MKKSILTLLALITLTVSNAQEIADTTNPKTKLREVGLTFTNLDSYGITYRFGNSKALWRFNAMGISGGNSTGEDSTKTIYKKSVDDLYYGTDRHITNDRKNENFNFNIRIGREYRFPIKEKLTFRLGADIGYGYGYNFNTYTSSEANSTNIGIDEIEKENFDYAINLVLGINYNITNSILFGFEVLPNFNYSKNYNYSKNTQTDGTGTIYSTTTTEGNSDGFYFGIRNTSAMLSLVFQF